MLKTLDKGDYHTSWGNGNMTIFLQNGTLYHADGSPLRARVVRERMNDYRATGIPPHILQAFIDASPIEEDDINLEAVQTPEEPNEVLMKMSQSFNRPPQVERILDHVSRGVVFRQRF